MNEAAPSRADAVAEGLTRFLAHELGPVSELLVTDVGLVSSIGNAREPWSFAVSWRDRDGVGRSERCVMLLKAEAGQLETELGPEFATIRALGQSDVPVPKALWCDETGEVARPAVLRDRVRAGNRQHAPRFGSKMVILRSGRSPSISPGLLPGSTASTGHRPIATGIAR